MSVSAGSSVDAARTAALSAVSSLFRTLPRGGTKAASNAPLSDAALAAISAVAGAPLLPTAVSASSLSTARAAVLGLPQATVVGGGKHGRLATTASRKGAPPIAYAAAAGIDVDAPPSLPQPQSKRPRGYSQSSAAAAAAADSDDALATASARLAVNAANASASESTARALAASATVLAEGAPAKLGPVRAKRVPAASRPDAGAAWFGMAAAEMTAEVKRDLLLLRHRAYLDPRQHYKGGGVDGGRLMELPRFFQVGTVVEAAHERLSPGARLTHAERKPTLVEALLADERLRKYAKKGYEEVAAKQAAGGRKAYRQARGRGGGAAAGAGSGRGGRSSGTRR